MQISNTIIPFAPEVNTIRVADGDTELYFLGRQFRLPKNARGPGYMTFHILFVRNMDFRILVPGFRLMNGRILPPQAKLFRMVFDHFYCGIALRTLIYTGINAFKERLPLDPSIEKATKALGLTPELLVQYNTIKEKEETIL